MKKRSSQLNVILDLFLDWKQFVQIFKNILAEKFVVIK